MGSHFAAEDVFLTRHIRQGLTQHTITPPISTITESGIKQIDPTLERRANCFDTLRVFDT